MSAEQLHEQKEDLSESVLDAHRAYRTLIEEVEAIDWYNQRAEATDDEKLRAIFIHNRNEEMEHACMTLEWIRRNESGWHERMNTYLFKDETITELEDEEESSESRDDLMIGRIRK
ncbi:MAG: hypothetical protein P8X42_02660 [Calditrichaceae bacterium]